MNEKQIERKLLRKFKKMLILIRNTNKENSVIAKGKNLLSIIVLKAIRFIKYIYKIVKPLIEALLDKAADIICEKQPNLDREKVKWVLLAIIIVLIFMIFS